MDLNFLHANQLLHYSQTSMLNDGLLMWSFCIPYFHFIFSYIQGSSFLLFFFSFLFYFLFTFLFRFSFPLFFSTFFSTCPNELIVDTTRYLAYTQNIPVSEEAVNWREVPGSKLSPFAVSIQMAFDLTRIRLAYLLGVWKIRKHTKRD